jgi:hypothetical protein
MPAQIICIAAQKSGMAKLNKPSTVNNLVKLKIP